MGGVFLTIRLDKKSKNEILIHAQAPKHESLPQWGCSFDGWRLNFRAFDGWRLPKGNFFHKLKFILTFFFFFFISAIINILKPGVLPDKSQV